LFFADRCFFCKHPLQNGRDANNRLHGEGGPVLAFFDHYYVYALRDIIVPPDVIEEPASLTVRRVEKESNLEIRTVLIERYGISKFLIDSGARKIHQDSFGTLYKKDLGHDEPLVMVKVANSTHEPDGKTKCYFIPVPPQMTTAREAVAWTFGMNAADYKPSSET
jgi:hypothetical protein